MTVHVVCAVCGTQNRVDPARVDAHPVCGSCKSPLFPGEPVVLGGERFDAYIARTELPVVVDFWADWCAPCRAMAPHFARTARELAGRMQFAKVDTEAERALAERYRIRSIPTMILFEGGKERDRRAGASSADELKRWLLVR